MNNTDAQSAKSTESALSMLSSIPTISGAIAETASGEYVTDSPQNTVQIVQQKFKDYEQVLMIFEAYQIIGQEHTSRLLALVVSTAGGTYAIFALTASRLPPRNSRDLTIDKIFPINDSFQINTEKKGSISQLQFELKNVYENASKYYYYPIISSPGAADFCKFYSRIIAVQKTLTPHSPSNDSVISYSWLNDYRQVGEVRQELKRREDEYIVYQNFSVYCATWNVNNKPYSDRPEPCPLHLWLSACESAPDIYAIALQELDTSAKALTFSENRPDTVWIQKMLENVHPQGDYEELISVRLVGMMLTILIKRHLRMHIARCRVKTIPRGVLNALGNKGGVAVSLQLNESNFCFVNSHLAAHMAAVAERNDDYAGIVKGLVFDDDLRRTINDHE